MALEMTMTRNKTGQWLLTVTDYLGAPQPLTGLTLWFHAAGLVGSTVLDINKSSPSGGITITNAAGGLATLEVAPADTADFPTGTVALPCELTLVSGAQYLELDRGSLSVYEDVGTP